MAEKLLIAPPETVISLAAKLDVASLEVKVRVSVASLVVAPSATALEPSVAVIAMVGTTLSKVQLNWVAAVLLLPAASVKVLAATSMVCACSARGKGSGVNGRASGREIADRASRDSDVACGKVGGRFASGKGDR